MRSLLPASISLLLTAGGTALPVPLCAAPGPAPTPEQLSFFESKIRPVLVKSCYECHSAESGKSKGGLQVDSRQALLQGGDSGDALVPGELKASLLWKAINWEDPDCEMPPRQKLADAVIADFKKWIEMGAPDPREAESLQVKSQVDLEQGKKFWAFQPPLPPAVPAVKQGDWAWTDVDRFVLAGMEAKGLKPVPDAQPQVLLRRLCFDLVGLPPTPQQIQAFAEEWKKNPRKAYAATVEKLLASPRFGEHWGRHWLDLARYAESTGKDVNMTFPHAWRYRDYVYDAFHADKPYDEFLREQIAGDLLPPKGDADWQENLIATGFLAMGTKGLNERNGRQFALDLADEQLDTTTQAVLGLTVACARCHDHKFDPIPTTDYYAMAGIFLSTETHFGTVNGLQNRHATDLLELPIADPHQPVTSASEIGMIQVRLVETEVELEQARRELRLERFQSAKGAAGAPSNRNPLNEVLRLSSTVEQLRARLSGLDEDGRAKTFAMGVQDRSRPVDATVLVRGDLDKPAQQVPRGLPQVLDRGGLPQMPSNQSGRLELARWLTSPDNPLTARVMANRIWQHLFGQGIVTSPNNFGATGTAPSHPELLDYLALRLSGQGWSIKGMIRELVMTRSYQLSAQFDAANYAIDPDNTRLWRSSPKRIPAESIRDAMLLASGELNLERPRGSLVSAIGDGAVGFRLGKEAFERPVTYRSAYLPIVRDALPEVLSLFDGADPSLVSEGREATNVPAQSLYLMNNEFVAQRAEAMGKLLLERCQTPRERAAHAFLRTYGRLATAEELESCVRFFQSFLPAAEKKSGNRQAAEKLAMTSFCQALFCSAEFRYLN